MISDLVNLRLNHPGVSHQVTVVVNMVAIRVVIETVNVLLPAQKIIEKVRVMQRAREKEKTRAHREAS